MRALEHEVVAAGGRAVAVELPRGAHRRSTRRGGEDVAVGGHVLARREPGVLHVQDTHSAGVKRYFYA